VPPQHSSRQTNRQPPPGPPVFSFAELDPPAAWCHTLPLLRFPSQFKLRDLTSSCWARARARERVLTTLFHTTREGGPPPPRHSRPNKQTTQKTRQDKTSEPKRSAHTTTPPRALSGFRVATWTGSRIRGPVIGSREGRPPSGPPLQPPALDAWVGLQLAACSVHLDLPGRGLPCADPNHLVPVRLVATGRDCQICLA
jgi:hypothetical protein